MQIKGKTERIMKGNEGTRPEGRFEGRLKGSSDMKREYV